MRNGNIKHKVTNAESVGALAPGLTAPGLFFLSSHSFTLDEAIAFAGEYSNDAAVNGEPEVTIDGKQYYYDELDLVY